jgi:CRISPR-associated protein Csy2
MIGDIKKVILLPHIQIQNANALSSPFTIGFPALTAWLGATHALQRKLNEDGFSEFKVLATSVTSHKADLKTYKGTRDFVSSIIGTANPLDKDGKRSSFIEEARIDLEVSLLIEYEGISKAKEDDLIDRLYHHLNFMRLAGGDILSFEKPTLFRIKEGDENNIKLLRRKLMPGFVLIERKDLMVEVMRNGKDAIDSLIDYLGIYNTCERENEEIKWSATRKTSGWIVPIAVGFQGISKLGNAKNQRDFTTPHRFAESVITLGEFKMPYKIDSLDEILWAYRFDKENDLYLCEQKN